MDLGRILHLAERCLYSRSESVDSEAWRPGFRDDAGRHSEMNPAAIPK
jgi:hypothetical protein